jgi:hypothetical protein
MEVSEVQGLVGRVGSVDPACRDRGELTAALAASARVRAWLDGREVALAAQLGDVASFPEADLAAAGRSSHRDAERVLERSRTVASFPLLGEALAGGEVSGGHVDVLGRAWRRLEPHARSELVARSSRLVEVAKSSTPDELERAAAAEVRRIEADGGMARLDRQKRASRVRSWVDRDGMWCLMGRLDPETGLRLDGRLRATVDALFAEQTPETCPSDPCERQGFLRAQALVALVDGRGGPAHGPQALAVIDATNPDVDGAPTIDWGLPVELPADVLRRWFDFGWGPDVTPVIVRGSVVLHIPGAVDLGRTTRLANRAQRRALRALYPHCAIPGCKVRFDLCKIHHVVWWEHGGATDLDNLLPLCVLHHYAVHDGGWHLKLLPDRQLEITYPDGTTQCIGPPRRGSSPKPAPVPRR